MEPQTEQQIITKLEKETIRRKSRAQRIDQLFLKYKKWFKETYETKDFKSPVMFFEKRSGEVEFYENVTTGLFEYKHSDGTTRFIIIIPSKQKKFGFANKTFKGYWCHEDYPLPLPEDPFLTVEQLNIAVEKALADVKEWKAKELKAKGDWWWKIGAGIALVIAAYTLFRLLVPQAPDEQIIRHVYETAEMAKNTTVTILP